MTLPSTVTAMASGDLNGDGFDDLVTSAAHGLYVMLGDGHGGYGSPALNEVTSPAVAMTIGDFSGDGIPDIAIADQSSVRLMFGLGGGRFTGPYMIYGAGGSSKIVDLIKADLNADSKLDLAVALTNSNGNAGSVQALINRGNAQFSAAGGVQLNAPPAALFSGDFNGDHKLDLLAMESCTDSGEGCSPGLQIVFGGGDGTLAASHKTFVSDSLCPGLVVMDVNGDGKSDVVTPFNNTQNNAAPQNAIATLISTGDGSFQLQTPLATPESINTLFLSDLNVDGLPDLVATSGNNTITLLYGQAGGTFQVGPLYVGGTSPTSAVVVSNGPTGSEIAVLNSVPGPRISSTVGAISLLPLSGGMAGAPSLIVTSFQPLLNVSADFNRDGKLDLMTSSPSGPEILLGNGDGTFQAPIQVASHPGYAPFAVADLNRDGVPDVILEYTGAAMNPPIVVLLGNGDGTFRIPDTSNVPFYPVAMTVADVNGDGIPDLIETSNSASYTSVGPVVFIGKGDGTFRNGVNSNINGLNYFSFVAADFDGDGKTDLVMNCSCTPAGGLALLRGKGDGTFLSPRALRLPMQVAYLTADLNNDGKPDLVGTYTQNFFPFATVLYTALGNGDGTFNVSSYNQIPLTIKPSGFSLVDVNADGKQDIAVTSTDMAIFVLGNGNGTFTLQNTLFLLGGSAFASKITFGDFNGDGKPDSVSTDDRAAIWVVMNQTP